MTDSSNMPPNKEEQNKQTIHIGKMNNSAFVAGDVHGDMIQSVSTDQSKDLIDLPQLAIELEQLRHKLKELAQTDEHDIAIGEVAQAEKAVKTNNFDKALNHLKDAGQWVLTVASEIGIPVAVEAIKQSIGLG